MSKFMSQFSEDYQPDYEAGGGESLVEPAGYVPADIQIRGMIEAGMRLGEARKEMFDYEGDVDVNLDLGQIGYDPTRSPGLDPADVSIAAQGLERRLKEQKAAAKKAVAESPNVEPPKEA